MRLKRLLPFLAILLAAVVLELTVFQISFWKTIGNRERVFHPAYELLYGHVAMEDMQDTAAEQTNGQFSIDEAGYTHVPAGEALIRIPGVVREVEQISLQIGLPSNSRIKATVFMRDEGNAYPYQLGNERMIWESLPQSKAFLVYPYGEVDDIYIRLQADSAGQELIFQLENAEINGRMPFAFSVLRLLLIYLVLLFLYEMRPDSRLHQILFRPEGCSKRQWTFRIAAVIGCVVLFTGVSCAVVLSNPECRTNLGMHHAQYQELAVALTQGKVTVGTADERLLQVENPYDTIYLQANQIPYQADYAYKDGNYYVYFGIVPELLCYLPYYILTHKALPNFAAILLFYAVFVVSCCGLVFELMRSRFQKVPFYLYPVCVFMLAFSYPLFYLQTRPDLYHVPIAASCMFTALSLWLVLAGRRLEKFRSPLWGLGAFCMALNAGCRPQFLLFSVLLIPLCAPYLLAFAREKGEKKTAVFQSSLRTWIAVVLPYLFVASGIMYYNVIRFGSPFDFGAAYSMTSNDMTHRGFNLPRIWYSAWYYLFEPPQLEGLFPYLRSAVIEADYAGRLVSESCFGGIFACSMLYWPVFLWMRAKKRLQQKDLAVMTFLSIAVSVIICAADATGAGILQRYMADQMPGFALAAVILLLCMAEWSGERGIYRHFAGWLTAALFLHIAFLGLILINTDSSVNLSSGNPQLYALIWSLLQF